MSAHTQDAASALAAPRYDHMALCLLPDRMLDVLFEEGTPPARQSIVGWDFNGFNTADVAFAIRKFRKGFYDDPNLADDEIGGYNVNIDQNGMLEPWIAQQKNGEDQRHSYFRVYNVRSEETDNLYRNAILLNYDCPRTPKWNPASGLRDYVVQVYPDNPDLLLGKAYFAVVRKRIFVSYFVLERARRGD